MHILGACLFWFFGQHQEKLNIQNVPMMAAAPGPAAAAPAEVGVAHSDIVNTVIAEISVRDLISYFSYFWLKV